jgi:hypothetical protein
MTLYRKIENPEEGELVQYLGMYVTRWQPYMGEPTVAFVENDYTLQDALDELDYVQLIDNTVEDAEMAKKEIVIILEKLNGKI